MHIYKKIITKIFAFYVESTLTQKPEKKNIFYMHILYNIPVKNACKKALDFSDFIKIKKNWKSNLKNTRPQKV